MNEMNKIVHYTIGHIENRYPTWFVAMRYKWKAVRPPTNHIDMKVYTISTMEAGVLIIAFQIVVFSDSMILLI